MRKFILAIASCIALSATAEFKTFPDGSSVDRWFNDTEAPSLSKLGKKYTVTDYGVTNDSTVIQTEKLQAVIDRAASEGGGVVTIPAGTFLSGSLFFKPGTHLSLIHI